LGLASSALNIIGISSLVPFLGAAVTGPDRLIDQYVASWAPEVVVETLRSHFFVLGGGAILAVALLKAVIAVLFTYFASDTLEKYTAKLGLQLNRGYLSTLGHVEPNVDKSELMYVNQQLPRFSSFNYALLDLNFKAFSLLGLLVVLLWMSPQLTLAAALLVAIVAGLVSPLFRWTRRTADSYFQSLRLLQSRLMEILDGAETIRGLGLIAPQMEKVQKANLGLIRSANHLSLARQSVASLPEVITFAMAVLGFSVLRPGSDQVVPIASFAFVVSRLLNSVNEFNSRFSLALELRRAAEDVYGFMKSRTEDVQRAWSGPGVQALQGPVLTLNSRDLVVKYAAKTVINGVSIEIPVGKRTRIIGKNGSGKSSFMRCLAGLQRYSGAFLLNGVELKNLSEEEYQRRLAYLPQNPYLFPGTLLENLQMGNPHVDRAQAVAICERIGLSPLLSRLPQGIDTVISESSANLSGGERQAICIARTFLRNAEIFLLDEYANHLDPAVRECVETYLTEGFPKGVTLLAITHAESRAFDLQLDFGSVNRTV
jgi:ABC-type multidrug transport system fused ATPase/permease subunit